MSVLKKIVIDQVPCLLWRRRHWVCYYKLLPLPTAGATNSYPHGEWRGDVNQRSFQSLARGRDKNYGNTQSVSTVSAQMPLPCRKVNQHDHMLGIFQEKMNIGIFGRNISLLSDQEFSFGNYRTLDSTNKRRIGQICQRATYRFEACGSYKTTFGLFPTGPSGLAGVAAGLLLPGVFCFCRCALRLPFPHVVAPLQASHHNTDSIPLVWVALSSDVSSVNSSLESAQMKWPGPLRREMLYISHRCCPTSFSDSRPSRLRAGNVIICAAGMT